MFQVVDLPEKEVEQIVAMVSYFMMHVSSDRLTGEAMRDFAEKV